MNGITFVFSSDMHKIKFIQRYETHREKVSKSLKNRFGYTINVQTLADLVLYETIEKRGFLIYTEVGEISCPTKVKLSGENLTKNN